MTLSGILQPEHCWVCRPTSTRNALGTGGETPCVVHRRLRVVATAPARVSDPGVHVAAVAASVVGAISALWRPRRPAGHVKGWRRCSTVARQAETPASVPPSSRSAIKGYFAFILISTAVRSCEAGIIASMMPAIKESLHLSYAAQGNLAGSPDYGIVPSGLIAMAIFQRVKAHSLLTAGNFVIGTVCVFGALFPSEPSLLAARAIGGLFWGFAAVHYPAWVNAKGPPKKRTLWMALINTTLLAGIVTGYFVGGSARATGFASWQTLLMLEGLLMLGNGVGSALFPQDLVQVDTTRAPAAVRDLRALLRSRLFLSTVAAGSFQSGAIGFMLYFCTQSLSALFGWSPKFIAAAVGSMIALGPILGILGGARYLAHIGGYINYAGAHQLTAACALGCLFCSLACLAGQSSAVSYGAASFGLLLFGAAPTAAINGIAVSAVPNASHCSSGAQFASQNLAKLLVPAFGGIVMDRVGLVQGYHGVLIFIISLYAIFAILAYKEAVRYTTSTSVQ